MRGLARLATRAETALRSVAAAAAGGGGGSFDWGALGGGVESLRGPVQVWLRYVRPERAEGFGSIFLSGLKTPKLSARASFGSSEGTEFSSHFGFTASFTFVGAPKWIENKVTRPRPPTPAGARGCFGR